LQILAGDDSARGIARIGSDDNREALLVDRRPELGDVCGGQTEGEEREGRVSAVLERKSGGVDCKSGASLMW